jgi:DNA polymerase elongation subunit (family B)
MPTLYVNITLRKKEMDNSQFKVITAWDQDNAIKAYCDVGGERKILTKRDFEWFFSISKEDYEKIGDEVFDEYTSYGVVKKLVGKGNYVRIYCDKGVRFKDDNNIVYSTWTLADRIKELGGKPLEADLSRSKCWLHEENVQIAEDLKVLFFDIETDDSLGGIKIGRDRILSFAACDTEGNVYFSCDDDEKVVLKELINTIHKYDVFCGWNSAKFDLPYLKSRMEFHGLEYDWNKRVHLDLMQRLIKLFAPIMGLLGITGFSLNEICRVFIHEEKVEFEGKIIDLFNKDREKLKEYNIQDVMLLKKLNEEIHILPLMIKECVWTGTFLNRFFIGELLDNYIIREARKKNFYLPSRPNEAEIERNNKLFVRGGYVMEAKTGMYENVRILDFKSLYPSVIVGWNIGGDSIDKKLSQEGDKAFVKMLNGRRVEDVTFDELYKFLMKEKKRLDPKDEHYQTANNNFYKREVESFISDLVQDLLNQRKTFKDKLNSLKIDTDEYRTARAEQEVVKEMANSMYGITADRSSRYFDINIAESITLTGQFLNKTLGAIATSMGYDVIYGDTDSVFIVVPEEDAATLEEKINEKLKAFLNEKFKLRNNIVYAEYEKKYGKMIMIDKKKYTGHMTWMDGKEISNIFSRGTENVKKDTTGFTRKHIVDLITMIVKEERPIEEIKQWVKDIHKKLMTEEIPKDDLSITMRVSKPTFKYKTMPIHVKLADKLIREGKMLQPSEGKNQGSARISYIVTSVEKTMEAVLLEEYDGKWDRKYYWEVQTYSPMRRILETAYPDHDWSIFSIADQEKKRKKEERERIKKEKEDAKQLKLFEREKKKEEMTLKKARIEEEKKKRRAEREKKRAEREELKAKKKNAAKE